MGTIQNAINNTLTTAAALTTLNPGLQQKAKDKAELKKLDNQDKLANAKEEALNAK